MVVRGSLGVGKIVNRGPSSGGSCGGNKKAGLAPTTGLNNVMFRHVTTHSVSIAMKSANVTCAEAKTGVKKVLGGRKLGDIKYMIPGATLNPYGSGGVGRNSRVGKFIW
jgi:hypothetical protein